MQTETKFFLISTCIFFSIISQIEKSVLGVILASSVPVECWLQVSI